MHMRRNKRQQRHMARPLDRYRQRTLVARTNACAATRQNLAAFGHAALQPLHIFIVHRANLICTEYANFAPGAKAAAGCAGATTSLIVSHKKPHLKC
jgi:hypothetical protein